VWLEYGPAALFIFGESTRSQACRRGFLRVSKFGEFG
jgi:hypothetical protein